MRSSSEEEAAPPCRHGAGVGSTPEPRRAWRRRIRRLLLAIIALLYVASVPWYRSPVAGDPPGMVLGLPDWVALALACYVAAAILNAVAWLLTELHDGAEGGQRPDEAPLR